ncbi:protein adenylyltransferase SelO family protein [Pararhodobacter zhoushanensis]|uniref:protein adenylyltransferase SelO family protein n=1 Tax=Pararhodobacter zhoushanensis TaxID=2479545 RepID=UPI0015F2CD5B
MTISFDNTYARDLDGMYLPFAGAKAPEPSLLWLNEPVAQALGLDAEALRSPEGLAMLTGGAMPEGASPLAMAYAGHQFGGFSAQLGDGRAMLVGEVLDRDGARRDIHLKGSGRTPFSRGGDGKAVLGPVLREVLIGEAMHGLGIPTTRALSAVATGETVWREGPEKGAVLARVASSHLRVGTFQFFYARQEIARLRRLADYAIRRHDPDLIDQPDRYIAFLQRVIDRQAALVAQWLAVGFVHGVMNTDNMTISGETIDYGPCAFIDAYDPAAVFSSIDHQGRYAYANQPALARWNLARLAESLLPLIAENPEDALPLVQPIIEAAEGRFAVERRKRFAAKLGAAEADDALIDGFLAMLTAQGADFTGAFRALATLVRGDEEPLRALIGADPRLDAWVQDWAVKRTATAAEMDAVNPLYIPRNHRVEEALAAANAGDLGPMQRLLTVFADPFTAKPGYEDLETPAPADAGEYVTYCGT